MNNHKENIFFQLQSLRHQVEKDAKILEVLSRDIASKTQNTLATLSAIEQNIQANTLENASCTNGEPYIPLFEFFKETKFLSAKWEQFFPIYERYVSCFKKNNQAIDLLELGVQNGGSLEMWKAYFPEDSRITGVDIDTKCLQIPFSEGIKFLLGDATKAHFVEENFKDTQFDVIIDDASHVAQDVINSFELLFPKLKMGGVYIIEDVHTSYWKNYGGGLKNSQSHMEYFKNLSDIVNFNWIKEDEYSIFADKLAYYKKLNQQISHIAFYDSVIVVEKFVQPVTKKFDVLKSHGQIFVRDYPEAIACDESFILKKTYR